MTFRFSLDVVLRVRQGLEHQQELLLRAANDRLATLESQREQIQTSLLTSAQQELRQLASGLSAAELQFDWLCRSILLERQHSLQSDISDARAARDRCAESFRQARQHREIIETVRRRQLELHRQVERRRDQRGLDDMFLLRRTRTQSS